MNASLLSFQQMMLANPPLLIALVFWSVIWKGLALWRAARNQSPIWFVALLIINTLGILEIVYLLAVPKKK